MKKVAEIVLSKDDVKVFTDSILNPPEPNEKLKEAAERYKEAMMKSVQKGLEESARGEIHDLGSFAQYADYEEDEGMPSLECKAAIFGMTALCDIEHIIYVSLNTALMEHGFSIPEESKADYAGMPIKDRLTILTEKDRLPVTLHEWIERRTEVFIRRAVSELPLEEPKLGLFQSLKKRDIKVAVFTIVSREALKLALTNLGIMGLVDVWLGKEDVELMPPDPAILEKALDQLGVDARSCVVVDSLYSSWVAAREKHFAMVVEIDSAKDVTEVLF